MNKFTVFPEKYICIYKMTGFSVTESTHQSWKMTL